MKTLLLQIDLEWESPESNRTHAKHIIDTSSEADLIILPEMFTTGFTMSPKSIAEKTNTKTLMWMQSVAKEKKAALAGSVATEEDGKYYNRFYFVKPDGSYTTYDKRHLFTFSGEDKEYTGGKGRVIVEHSGFRILLQVCYDLRFPVFSRNKADYDMIIYIASWPVPRIEAWNALLRARAIENVCYVAGVNRVGNDPNCQYNGNSVLLDYLGKDIVTGKSGSEQALLGEIEKESLLEFRQKFPALNDADKFRLTDI